jgi:DHA1 family tetracycline resistance protein-like MFS transporter
MNPPAPSRQRHALAFVLITMLVDTIGLGIVIPVMPQLVATLGHGSLSDAARWGGGLMFVYALMQFLCAPIMGNLSDRFGRRPVLILALLALGVDYLVSGLAPTLGWLFLARLLSGAAGATYPTVNAYIADITPPERRSVSFGLTGAAFGVGFILGPAIGGIVGQHFGPRAPFFVAAAIAGLNALYGTFVLAESLPIERRRHFEWWRANPLGSLMALRRFPALLPMLVVLVLMRFAHDANPSVWSYFVMLRFHWTPADVGNSLALVGVTLALVMGLLTRVLIPRIGETRAVVLGLTSAGIACTGYAFAPSSLVLCLWIPAFALFGLASPALNGLMSRSVPDTEQGELQGAVASLGGLTSIFAPPTLTQVFGYFTGPRAPWYFPGAAYLLAGASLYAAAATFMATRPRRM